MIHLTDGRVVSGSDDYTIKIWDTISSNCLITLRGHTSYVWLVTQLTDGTLVSASANDTLKIWDIISGCFLLTLLKGILVIYGVCSD